MLAALAVLVLVAAAEAAVPRPVVTELSPRGIRFEISDTPGVRLVALHFSVNKNLAGVRAGDYNVDITSKTNGKWVYENRNINVKPGDKVNYWVYQIRYGRGEQLTNQVHHVVKGGTGNTGTGTGTGTPVSSGKLQLVLDEQFSGSSLNMNNWDFEVTTWAGGNNEYQIYSPETKNTFVKDGKLFIKPSLTSERFGEAFLTSGTLDLKKLYGKCTMAENWGCFREAKYGFILPTMSGKINSKITFRYGRVEIMAKMPRGDWLWPAIWLLPRPYTYGGWPRSGEIDLVESRGNRNYGNIGVQQMGSTLHWGTSPGQNRWGMTHKSYTEPNGKTWADGMHKYVLDWDETGLRTYVDGRQVLNTRTPSQGYYRWGNFPEGNVWASGSKAAPFDKPFYLTLNVAVAGNFFPDGVRNSPHAKPWKNNERDGARKFYNARSQWLSTWHGDDAAMQVDYIKIWEKK